MTTEIERTRIAAAINQLRPDWPAASIRTILARPDLAERPRRDVAVALTWVACDSATTTPARVCESGPWWQAVAADDGLSATPRPPRKDEVCELHPGSWATNCSGCASDQLANQPTEARRPRERAPDEISTAVGLARAALIRAKANLCPHGVDPERCQHPDHANPTHPRPEHESNEEKR